MKIAVIRRECGSGLGGAENYCAGVVQKLCKAGHNVTVIADSADSCLEEAGAGFIRAPVSGRGSIMKNMSFFMAVQQVLRANEFDVAYGLSRVMPVDILRISDPLHAAWLEFGYAGGLLSIFRRFMPRHSCLLSIERKSINAAKKILTNSLLVAEQVRHYYGVPPEKILTIHNGFDPERFFPVSAEQRRAARRELGLPEGKDIILFAGTNLWRKGFDLLLQALQKQSSQKDFVLVVAGPEPDKNIFSFAGKYGLSDRLIVPGYVEDMARYYQAADLFVLPTRYDPFANTCLEASACGVPVVTTSLNGASEIIIKAARWLVVPAGDSDALAGSVSRFLSTDAGSREELGKEMIRAASSCTVDSHMEKLIESLRGMER